MERNYISLADLFDQIAIGEAQKLRDPMSNDIKEAMLMTMGNQKSLFMI